MKARRCRISTPSGARKESTSPASSMPRSMPSACGDGDANGAQPSCRIGLSLPGRRTYDPDRHAPRPRRTGAVKELDQEVVMRRTTDIALRCGIVAGPLFVVVGLAQAFTREGFDLREHTLSLLSNGGLGWIQIANFIVSGLLFIVGAAGIRTALPTGRAHRWGPRLIGAFGVGMAAAGVFSPDPAFGFPPGTPDGKPDSVSWHGALHYTVASLAFIALIAA